MRSQLRQRVLCSCLAWGLALAGVTSIPAENELKPNSQPFHSLFNGRNLEGWETYRGDLAAWKADGEVLSCLKDTDGWLRTKKLYSDFVLRFDYRVSTGGDSGVGIRVPTQGDVHKAGMEVQLLDDYAPEFQKLNIAQYTGSIYWQAPAKRGAAKPAGEWNTFEMTCAGQHVKIVLNGQVINDIDLDTFTKAVSPKMYSPLAERPQAGFIALQNHGWQIDFRKLEIQDLTTTTATGLQYYDIKVGDGAPVLPTAKVYYSAWLTDGTNFESNRNSAQPTEFPRIAGISGWTEGLSGMKAGGRRKLIIPANLAYGKTAAGSIPAHSTLIFDVEVPSAK